MQRYMRILYIGVRMFADNMRIFAMSLLKTDAYEVNNE